MIKQSSILNDVLGPVMTGPSSSHTATPGKIGLSVYRLWGSPIRSAAVIYDQNGSYPSTHIGQGSDFGFAAGLLGLQTDDPQFRDSLQLASQTGVSICFRIAKLGAHHPNEARIDVAEAADSPVKMSVLSYSTGGGTFLLSEMDGFPISFDGQRQKCYLACRPEAGEWIGQILNAENAVFQMHQADPARTTAVALPASDAILFEIEGSSCDADGLRGSVAGLEGLYYFRVVDPAVPAPLRLMSVPPFTTAAETLEYARKHHITSMPDLAVLYECSLCLLDHDTAYQKMENVLQAMRRSMLPPPEDDPVQNLIVPRYSSALNQRKMWPLDMGVVNVCMQSAVSVMENSCAHRAVVAAPTAGSSGVIPAAVVSVGRALGRTDQQILDALWACGLVGAYIANQATFGAEVAGCQAEIGASACMAAAGVVQLMGGTPEQGFHAACIAMHSFLGLICDPVAGLVEFPCIERNVTASAAAVMAANMALCGITSLVSLDETIQTMLEVGKMLPRELCCTCQGGLCATKAGRAAADRVAQRQTDTTGL